MRSIKRNLPVWICIACLLVLCWGPLMDVMASTIGKPGGAFYQTVQDEGVDLAQESKLNFSGGGVSCVDNAGVSTDCTITGLAASAYDTIQDEGVGLTQRTTLDFAGAGVSCADSGGAKSLCTIPGAGTVFYQTMQDEGVPLTQRATFDFAGAGVTCVDSGGTKSLCTIPGGAGALSGWNLIDTDTAAGAAAIVLDQNLDNSSDRWMLDFYNVSVSTDGTAAVLQVSTDGGATWEVTNYRQNFFFRSSSGTTGAVVAATSIRVHENIGNAAAEQGSAKVWFWNPGSSSVFKQFRGVSMAESSGNTTLHEQIGGSWAQTTVIDAVRLIPGAGTISGTGRLYRWTD